MTQTLHETIINDSWASRDDRWSLFLWFGTFLRSMLTMFEITLAPGAWSTVGRLLIFGVHWMYGIVFFLYGWIITFAVTRVITALFLKHTMNAATADAEIVMADKKAKKEREERQLRNM